MSYELEMFPLEHPVVPGQVIPLVLFEPRYLELAEHLAASPEAEFGIVGIERGREVGGAEQRGSVGVVARVLELTQLPDGRFTLVASGTRRIRIENWLDDDPYPRAEVADWPDPIEDGLDAAVAGLEASVQALLDTALRRQPDLGLGMPELQRDQPERCVWQLIGFSGLGPLDTAELLAVERTSERAAAASRIVDERRELLDALGDDDL